MSTPTLSEVNHQIAELERRHPNQEWRPWACADDPLALEHWGLVQARIRLKREPKRAAWTPERRIEAGKRLRQGRMAIGIAIKPTEERISY